MKVRRMPTSNHSGNKNPEFSLKKYKNTVAAIGPTPGFKLRVDSAQFAMLDLQTRFLKQINALGTKVHL